MYPVELAEEKDAIREVSSDLSSVELVARTAMITL